MSICLQSLSNSNFFQNNRKFVFKYEVSPTGKKMDKKIDKAPNPDKVRKLGDTLVKRKKPLETPEAKAAREQKEKEAAERKMAEQREKDNQKKYDLIAKIQLASKNLMKPEIAHSLPTVLKNLLNNQVRLTNDLISRYEGTKRYWQGIDKVYSTQEFLAQGQKILQMVKQIAQLNYLIKFAENNKKLNIGKNPEVVKEEDSRIAAALEYAKVGYMGNAMALFGARQITDNAEQIALHQPSKETPKNRPREEHPEEKAEIDKLVAEVEAARVNFKKSYDQFPEPIKNAYDKKIDKPLVSLKQKHTKDPFGNFLANRIEIVKIKDNVDSLKKVWLAWQNNENNKRVYANLDNKDHPMERNTGKLQSRPNQIASILIAEGNQYLNKGEIDQALKSFREADQIYAIAVAHRNVKPGEQLPKVEKDQSAERQCNEIYNAIMMALDDQYESIKGFPELKAPFLTIRKSTLAVEADALTPSRTKLAVLNFNLKNVNKFDDLKKKINLVKNLVYRIDGQNEKPEKYDLYKDAIAAINSQNFEAATKTLISLRQELKRREKTLEEYYRSNPGLLA